METLGVRAGRGRGRRRGGEVGGGPSGPCRLRCAWSVWEGGTSLPPAQVSEVFIFSQNSRGRSLGGLLGGTWDAREPEPPEWVSPRRRGTCCFARPASSPSYPRAAGELGNASPMAGSCFRCRRLQSHLSVRVAVEATGMWPGHLFIGQNGVVTPQISRETVSPLKICLRPPGTLAQCDATRLLSPGRVSTSEGAPP